MPVWSILKWLQPTTVTVTDADENTAPTITSNGGSDSASISVAENQTAVTTVAATDPDTGDTLTNLDSYQVTFNHHSNDHHTSGSFALSTNHLSQWQHNLHNTPARRGEARQYNHR